MKVPRIALGTEVMHEGRQWQVYTIDRLKKTFAIGRQENVIRGIASGEAMEGLSTETDYNPVPNRANFLRAIEEWNYDYRQSADQRWVDDGQLQEAALKKMFKELSSLDREFVRKIVCIAVE